MGDIASGAEVRNGQVWFQVPPERVADAARIVKDDPDIDCGYFNFLSAIDWQDDGFEVVTLVYSLTYAMTVAFTARLPKENPSLPTLTSVYMGADWHERECAEMFGITFEGHPNPQNLYLADDFEGHPLRKDFKLASRTYKPWPGAKDPDEAGGR
ncbi:MAG TPA: NADH-quinone oxidoreductase subunit C [Actinomycetota bacterium]|nr:NADH-quinone oxidoreductase subunit C [Actinomycetota bacterium]